MPADIAVGVDVATMNATAAAIYTRLYPNVFKGSQQVTKDGLEFDVAWDVHAAPTVALGPPPGGEQILADHLAEEYTAANGPAIEDVQATLVQALTATTFQLVMDNVTMTVSGSGQP